MTDKEPVLLIVLIETANRRWSVAGTSLDGHPVPLMCTEPGDFDPVVGETLDEQVSYLRHRLSGVLQRGCDRLWGRQMKPRQIIFIADDDLEQSHPNLVRRVADHFVEWMTSPPVAFFVGTGQWLGDPGPTLNNLAGDLEQADQQALAAGLPPLIKALDDRQVWEVATSNPTT